MPRRSATPRWIPPLPRRTAPCRTRRRPRRPGSRPSSPSRPSQPARKGRCLLARGGLRRLGSLWGSERALQGRAHLFECRSPLFSGLGPLLEQKPREEWGRGACGAPTIGLGRASAASCERGGSSLAGRPVSRSSCAQRLASRRSWRRAEGWRLPLRPRSRLLPPAWCLHPPPPACKEGSRHSSADRPPAGWAPGRCARRPSGRALAHRQFPGRQFPGRRRSPPRRRLRSRQKAARPAQKAARWWSLRHLRASSCRSQRRTGATG